MAAPRIPAAAALACATLVACTATPVPTTTAPNPVTQPPTAAAPAPASTSAGPVSPDRQKLVLEHKQLPGMTTPPPGSGLDRYLAQKIEWKSCLDKGPFECADVLAPMDYAEPDGVAITLHMTRRRATADRRGAMFVNPGGPGEPSEDIVQSRRWDNLPHLDIVGWDTRGTGGSTPVKCYPDDATATRVLDEAVAVDTSPDDEAEYQAMKDAAAGFAKSCAENSGDYLKFISSVQTVQDLDLLRQLLGEEKLTYTGYSYGTWLGSVYATYFPDKVGRMVLDSAVNVTDDKTIIQAQGFDRALGLFADWEAKQGRIAKDHAAVVAAIGAFLDRLDAEPLQVGDRQLTQSLAVTGIVTLLYGDEREWAMLEQVLVPAMKRGDGSGLLQMADFMNDRDPSGTYGVRYASFPAILCVDEADRGLAAARTTWGEDIVKAPFFGKYFGPGVTCETWAVPAVGKVKISAPSAAPIVVVGSTGDAATPYEFAGWMADALGSGVLLTWDGPGHGSYGNGNACLDGAVNAYLNEGKVPAKGTVCKP